MGLFDRLFRRSRPEPDHHAPGLFTARSTTVPPELGGVPTHADEPPAPPEDLWDRPAEPTEPPVGPAVEPAEVAAVEALEPEPEPGGPAPEPPVDDLPGYVVETVTPAAEAPVEPLWDDATWEDAEPEVVPEPEVVAEPEPAGEVGPVEGSTADEPLFADHAAAPPAPEPDPEPVPPLFDRPAMAYEPPPEVVAAPDELEPEPEVAPVPEVAPAPQAQVDDEGRTMRVHDGRLDKRPGPIKMTPSEALALAQDGPRALRRERPHGQP